MSASQTPFVWEDVCRRNDRSIDQPKPLIPVTFDPDGRNGPAYSNVLWPSWVPRRSSGVDFLGSGTFMGW